MGIQGLLPALKSITVSTHVKQYTNQTLGVDAYVWLHRGALSCSWELAHGKYTTRYVDYAMHRVRMLKHYGIVPYIVLDGDYLPSKAKTETEREERRRENTRLGKEMAARGNKKLAQDYFQKAIDITPEMALRFIRALQDEKIDYVVAPYEADAQLAYLERIGIIDGIITEDSDLLVFGCKKVLFKMNEFGECMEIDRARFLHNHDLSLVGWTDHMFRYMAILSGCDYLSSIPGMGLKTAHRIVKKYKTLDNIMRGMRLEIGVKMSDEYEEKFRRADLTFQHQRVFCPQENAIRMWNLPSEDLDEETLKLIGAQVDNATARQVASGTVDPITKEVIRLEERNDTRLRIQRGALKRSMTVPANNTSITSFLKPASSGRVVVQPLSDRSPNRDNTNNKKRESPGQAVVPIRAKKLKLSGSTESFFGPNANDENSPTTSRFFAPRRRAITPKKIEVVDQDLAEAIKRSVEDERQREALEGFQNPIGFEISDSLCITSQNPQKTLLRDTSTVSSYFEQTKPEQVMSPSVVAEESVEHKGQIYSLPTPPNSQHEAIPPFAVSTDHRPLANLWRQNFSASKSLTRTSSLSRLGSSAMSRSASTGSNSSTKPYKPPDFENTTSLSQEAIKTEFFGNQSQPLYPR